MLRSFEPVTEFGRLVRFGFVGFLNFFVYTGMTLLAIEVVGLSPVVGSLVGQTVSVVVSYIGHFSYSFKAGPYHRIFIWRFAMTVIILFGVNIIVTWLLTNVFDLSHWISIAVISVLIPLMSFLLNRFWVFTPGLRSASGKSEAATGLRPRADRP